MFLPPIFLALWKCGILASITLVMRSSSLTSGVVCSYNNGFFGQQLKILPNRLIGTG